MAKAVKILGFDSSSGVTGWALVTTNFRTAIKLKEFDHFKIRPRKGKKTRSIPERLDEFSHEIMALLSRLKPDYVAFEEHHINKISAAKVLFKFMGVGLQLAYQCTGREIIELTPREIRTEIGINWMGGEIAKEMVLQAVEKFFDITVDIEDESDAIAVAMVAVGRVRILEGRR